MKIAIGADHGGYKMKNKLVKFLKTKGFALADLGTHSAESCDYPAIGYKVAASVSSGQFPRGILICKTGVGFSIVANKLPGVRAALCLKASQARASREHNNSNILILAANYLSATEASRIVDAWLKAEFSPKSRHGRRVRQIANIERKLKKLKLSGVKRCIA